MFVGTERGIEAKLVPQAGMPLELIRAAGLKGIGGAKLLRNAALLPAGLWDSEKILRRHRVNVALGVGGYASGPMMLLAVAAPHSHRRVRAERRARLHQSRARAAWPRASPSAHQETAQALRRQVGRHRLPDPPRILRRSRARSTRRRSRSSSPGAAAALIRSIGRSWTRSIVSP